MIRVSGRIEGGTLEYKVLVLGCSQVGKSSLIGRYTTGRFSSGLMSTVGKRQLHNSYRCLSMHSRPKSER